MSHAEPISRRLWSDWIFERVPLPWWAYTYESVEENIFPSEDMWFSHICRQNGVKLWVDTTVTSPHLIANLVDEDTFRRYIAENPDAIAERKKTKPKKPKREKAGVNQ